jgi:putative SOS response-associated peptidase YedK
VGLVRFAILTTAANNMMECIHDRTPVIFDWSSLDEWLDPELHETMYYQLCGEPP